MGWQGEGVGPPLDMVMQEMQEEPRAPLGRLIWGRNAVRPLVGCQP